MPSGYTDQLYRGEEVTFEQFVLRCSRAMGAAIMQRDESLDVEIQLREVSDLHLTQGEEARAALDEALARSDEEWATLEAEDRAKRLQAMRESIASRGAIRARYEAMLAQVRGWEPPSFDHIGLQKFMVEQLEESIQHDCELGAEKTPAARTAAAYRAEVIKALEWRVAYHEGQYADEVKRVAGQNEWVLALRESLGLPALSGA